MKDTQKNPIIAIVGKPNVGKSTFFNKLIGKQVSITSEISGTTRDRIMATILWQNKSLTLIDTAGLDDDKSEPIAINIKKQVEEALDQADLILFMVDGTDTLDRQDLKIADKLRKSRKPLMLLVSKSESPKVRQQSPEYYSLGLGNPWPVSGIHGTGVAEVLDEMVKILSKDKKFNFIGQNDENIKKVALIGRPNTGKSTLLNKITNSQRSVISDISGTTRDSINSKVQLRGREIIFIDTAGIRKSGKIQRGIEKYSVIRTLRSIDESDLSVILVDGFEGFSRGDVHLITHALEAGKQIIIAINKTDLADPDDVNINKFSFIRKLPYVFISAKTGKGVDILVERICSLLG